MLVAQRSSRTYSATLLYSMLSSYSGIPSMFFISFLDMVLSCGSTDTASLHQSPFPTTSIHKASVLNPPTFLSIKGSISLQSTIWCLQALALLFFFRFPSPLFSLSLPISPFLHLHLFIRVFIISAIGPVIYNFFLATFSLTFLSIFFIIPSSFPLIAYIKMYHRAHFTAEFSATFLSNPALL